MGTAHSHNPAFACQIRNAELSFDGDEWGRDDDVHAHGYCKRKERKARTMSLASARRMKGKCAIYANEGTNEPTSAEQRMYILV